GATRHQPAAPLRPRGIGGDQARSAAAPHPGRHAHLVGGRVRPRPLARPRRRRLRHQAGRPRRLPARRPHHRRPLARRRPSPTAITAHVTALAADFSAAERDALAGLAGLLWDARAAIAAEWSEAIAAARPQDVAPRGPLTVESLALVNEAFLTA